MQRPTGVTVAAVLLKSIAILSTLATIIFIQVGARQHAGYHAVRSALLFGVLPILITISTWCMAAGVARNRNWARIGSIALGILMALFGALLLLITALMLITPQIPPLAMSARFGWVLGAFFCLLLSGFGLWLALYLNSNIAKEAFLSNFAYVPDTIAYPAPPFALETLAAPGPPSVCAPAHGYTKVALHAKQGASGGTTLPRILVLIFSVLWLVGAIFMLWHAFSGSPYLLLGFLMQGKAANISRLCVGTLVIVLVAGLYLRYRPAFFGTLILQVTNIASLSLMLFPRYRARSVMSTAHPAHPIVGELNSQGIALAHALQISSFVLAVTTSIIFVWALWCELPNTCGVSPLKERAL